MLNLREFFLEKKSWSQMIQNCLIRREMAKKKFCRRRRFSAAAAVNGGQTKFSLYSHSYVVITNHHTKGRICKVGGRPRKHTSRLGFKNRHCCPPPLIQVFFSFLTRHEISFSIKALKQFLLQVVNISQTTELWQW